MNQQLLGESHPDVATNLNNLGMLYYYQGRYAEAEPLLQQALAIWEKTLGPEHPHTQAARHNLQLLLEKRDPNKSNSNGFFQQVVNFFKS